VFSDKLVCTEGGKGGGGYRSRFMENKAALSQFTKNTTLANVLHEARFTENKRERFGKSRFTATMEITIHEEKINHFTIHGEKKGRSRVTKIPFTTLCSVTNI